MNGKAPLQTANGSDNSPERHKLAYDEVFNVMADAEMQLRNKNYWQVVNRLNHAAEIAKRHARELS